tara:strand:+ start:59 stop:610 length:552 start_codon:yes stop_codon:yes gene_type:complete
MVAQIDRTMMALGQMEINLTFSVMQPVEIVPEHLMELITLNRYAKTMNVIIFVMQTIQTMQLDVFKHLEVIVTKLHRNQGVVEHVITLKPLVILQWSMVVAQVLVGVTIIPIIVHHKEILQGITEKFVFRWRIIVEVIVNVLQGRVDQNLMVVYLMKIVCVFLQVNVLTIRKILYKIVYTEAV